MNREAKHASSKKKSIASRVPVTVRLPEHVIQKIDEELGGRDVPLSRNNWLLEAAIEKLKRNGKAGVNGTQ